MAKPKSLKEIVGKEMTDLLNSSIVQSNDLVFVIICAAFIEQCLGSILVDFLLEGTTSEKLIECDLIERARLLYSLGIIPKSLFQNIEVIAQIRNKFAHSHLALTFDDPDVIKKTNNLKYLRQYHEQNRPPKNWTAKERFTASTAHTVGLLIVLGVDIERVKPPKIQALFSTDDYLKSIAT
jgi:hypothetical protein